MNRKPLVIVESPYAGQVEANVEYARKAVRDCVLRGEAPIASHLLFTQPGILDDLNEAERALGIACGLAWTRVADYSVFYTDRGWSRGMLAAFEKIALNSAQAVGVQIRGFDIVIYPLSIQLSAPARILVECIRDGGLVASN